LRRSPKPAPLDFRSRSNRRFGTTVVLPSWSAGGDNSWEKIRKKVPVLGGDCNS
jgi:hypothetical protein